MSLVVANTDRRRGLVALLEANGYRVGSTAGVVVDDEGWATADSLPAVVVIDAHLPDRDGLHLCRMVTGEHPGIKVIMLAATVPEDLKVQALAAGASDIVEMDIRGTNLLAALARATKDP